jgi:hypothetical protein
MDPETLAARAATMIERLTVELTDLDRSIEMLEARRSFLLEMLEMLNPTFQDVRPRQRRRRAAAEVPAPEVEKPLSPQLRTASINWANGEQQ